LKPSTKALKARNADKIPILNDNLRDALAAQATAHRLLFGSNQPYAATHQLSVKRGAFCMSRRGRRSPGGKLHLDPSWAYRRMT
jgi:phage gpG-like protein